MNLGQTYDTACDISRKALENPNDRQSAAQAGSAAVLQSARAVQHRGGRYRLIFRYHGRQQTLNLGMVSPEEAESKVGHV